MFGFCNANNVWEKIRPTPLLIAACFVSSPCLANQMDKTIFSIKESTIKSTHAALKSRELDCVGLIQRYLFRIKKYNFSLKNGAPVNAFVALNPNALKQANKLDSYFNQSNELIGPLHCIPVVVKDNIDTVDTPSTSGSLALLGSQPISNAFLVNKIRAAGGIVIGKAAMDEFASGGQGISGRSGRIGNVYDPNQNPGGSSGGSAVAVSANFAILGIGTDNSGSVRVPAAFNGVYAIRPSTGLISNTGIFPRGKLDGVAGVMARSIPDLAIALAVIANKADSEDLMTKDVLRLDSYANELQNVTLKGKRIGIVLSVAGYKIFDVNDTSAMVMFSQVKTRLENSGAALVEIKLPLFDTDRSNNMAGEVQDVDQYLGSFASTRKNYRDICLSERTRLSVQDCLGHIESIAPKYSPSYYRALGIFDKNRTYVEGLMRKDRIDALLMPLSSWRAPSYYSDVLLTATTFSPVASNAGLPAIALVGGWTSASPAMPVGFELIGYKYGEGDLIGLAHAYASQLPDRPLPNLKAADDSLPFVKMCLQGINYFITQAGWRGFKQFLSDSKEKNIDPAAYRSFFEKQTQDFIQRNKRSVQSCE